MDLIIIRGRDSFSDEIQVWETTADNLVLETSGVYIADDDVFGCKYLGEFYAKPFKAIFGWVPEEGTAYSVDGSFEVKELIELED